MAAESGLPHDYGVGTVAADFGEVDAPTVEHVTAEVGHEHVADANHFKDQVPAGIGADVEGDAPLAALVFRLAGAAGPRGNEGHLVEDLVGLDLDDLCAQGSQDAAGER